MLSIPLYLREKNKGRADLPALRYADGRERKEITFGRLGELVDRFARGLLAVGVKPGDRVFLFADNCWEWMVADLGILRAGAVSVPRGADTLAPEAEYILRHSGATAVVVGKPALLDLIPDDIPLAAHIVLSGDREDATTLEQLLALGETGALPDEVGDLATVVYTSGTTGVPKGVMLTHANILHNVRAVPKVIDVGPGDRFLSVLPSWHMFERTAEYVLLACGATLSYSTLRTLKDDMKTERPTFLVAVPRLFEGMYDGFHAQVEKKSPFGKKFAKFLIDRAQNWADHCLVLSNRLENPRETTKKSRFLALFGAVFGAPLGLLGKKIVGGKLKAVMGGRLKGAISGGGMLALHIDRFLHALGVPIIVGYGLTETSPVVTIRLFEDNVLGTIGRAVIETELRVVDASGEPVPVGARGELEVRGPQVMPGYYQNEQATAAVLREGGWFRTGDLVEMTKKGDIIFTGRQKETIVLAGGENIEPYPIEARILESPYVKQVMVVGQDRKVLGALLVPDAERVEPQCRLRGISVEDLLTAEVKRLLTPAAGFKARESVSRIAVLDREFSVEDGMMTRTLKLKRNEILKHYEDLIDSLFNPKKAAAVA